MVCNKIRQNEGDSRMAMKKRNRCLLAMFQSLGLGNLRIQLSGTTNNSQRKNQSREEEIIMKKTPMKRRRGKGIDTFKIECI